jgi:hypothetical protein
MAKFSRGQTVKFKRNTGTALKDGVLLLNEEKFVGNIICQDHNNPDIWSVLIRDGNNSAIKFVEEKDLSFYKNNCWSCYDTLNSKYHMSCLKCGWIVCPDCEVCRKPCCYTINTSIESTIEIESPTSQLKVIKKTVQCELFNSEDDTPQF